MVARFSEGEIPRVTASRSRREANQIELWLEWCGLTAGGAPSIQARAICQWEATVQRELPLACGGVTAPSFVELSWE